MRLARIDVCKVIRLQSVRRSGIALRDEASYVVIPREQWRRLESVKDLAAVENSSGIERTLDGPVHLEYLR